MKSLIFLLGLLGATRAVTVSVSATASHPIPTTLWGQMFEVDPISRLSNFTGDGGLYAELLQNRAFQQVTPGTSAALNAWQAVNGATISVIAESVPVSSALPNALHVVIPNGRTGPVGFANTGYFGIKVTASTTYSASFFYRFPTASSFRGTATVSLQTSSGQILGSSTVSISGAQTSWQQLSVQITPTITPSSTGNLFVITLDGSAAAGQTINFAMLSLFPPTFKDRPNGMRIDIAEALSEMRPSFFRFPGGNNLEGQTVATRWQWNATVWCPSSLLPHHGLIVFFFFFMKVGPLVERPGRVGDWGYINTDGLGLFEYLTWCEDLNMIPIMAVWAGFALGGTSVAEADLQPFIQQAIDQINFVIGAQGTSEAADLRVSLGHPEPFALTFVEVGNEDFFAANTYVYRWHDFVDTLQAQFPDLHFIATSDTSNPILSPNPTEYDIHVYQTPSWFAQNSFFYDGFERNVTRYFEGEYAAISTNPDDIFGTPADGRLTFPTMQSSTGEAAFMTGLERNSDIVFAASYAPLLNHVANSQWTPNLVSFDSGAVYRSTSFYVQMLFSQNRGDEYIPSTLPNRTGTIFWSVVRNTTAQSIIIKVSNTIATETSLTFNLPFTTVATTGTLQIIQGSATTSNTPTTPNAAVPVTSSIGTGKTFTYNAPGFSFSVITLVAH
ncbi:putative alpha-N-arabinofuranosidase A [Termitomyces sp. J132]|nr:putative alpha-N-arabinofuranosidase A [Termitomyces sp. J132]